MKNQFTDKIRLQADMSFEQRVITIEYARALGFLCEAATFPVTSWEEGLESPASIEAIGELQPVPVREVTELPDGYDAASDHALPITDWDGRSVRGLESVLANGSFLKDENLDELPDTMDVHMILSADASDAQFEAAVNLAFRMGMETTAYEGALVRSLQGEGNEIVFAGGEKAALSYESKEDGVKMIVSGDGEELLAMMGHICETFPLQGTFDTWTDRMQEMCEAFAMKTLDGQLTYLEASGIAENGTAYVEKTIDAIVDPRRDIVEKYFPQTTFESYKDQELVYEKEYDITWEVDELRSVLENEVSPQITAGSKVKIQAAVSEDKMVRAELEAEIKEAIEAKGATAEVSIICSYKQGYSWIDEKINPVLAALGNVKKVQIAFKPFLPEGETVWKDEDGATPKYNNLKDDPDSWYDLPIRYLQELYPIEDAIVEAVSVEPDDIEFVAFDGEDDLTYRLKAFDADGSEIFSEDYLATCDERQYLDAYPQLGKVHPSTGYVRVWKDDVQILDERVASDVEKIWDLYQADVLSTLRDYVDKVTEGRDLVSAQPFFSKLQLDVVVSEPNELLNSREDLFSTLDGLHEDMYFCGTDYFKNYGMEKAGAVTDAPGLILPVIKKGTGKPCFKVSLFALKKTCPTIVNGDQVVTSNAKKWDAEVWMKQMSLEDGRYVATVHVGNVEDGLVGAYAKLLNDGILQMADKIYGVDVVRFETEKGIYEASVKEPVEAEKNLNIEDIDILERTLIGYEQCMELIEQLKHVKGLNVYQTTESYMGRSLFAVEFKPHLEGYISRVKRITNHPTELINTRHHANEVSGTNEAFRLIRTILTEEKYASVPDDMNLILVPMENVDGTAIHYELQKDNPTWKFHVARFNAVGKEFYYDHFVDETIHREAVGLKRLFMNKLPDFLIDNHGVPSHEWEQQFAGYTSPSYRGFWLPRSLIYGYFFHIAGEPYESNITLNKQMEDVVADAFLADEEITKVNLSWARQFEKYAHEWMPKLFPANYYKNMINYWIPSKYDPMHRYPSIKFPWILSVDYVSEVADETSQGDYLYDCANAHLVHDLAIIEMIVNCSYVYDKEWNYTGGDVKVSMTRKRPVIA